MPEPATPWRRGRRIGVDVGRARIGVASCDPDGILASPVETVAVRGGEPAWGPELRRLGEIVDEYEALELVVGLPVNLRGAETASTAMARSLAARWERERPDVPVVLVDERMSTGAATRALRASGHSARSSRAVVDQAAAVEILQNWLDARHTRS